MTKEEIEEIIRLANASRSQVNQTLNFNGPVGQQIAHVDKIVAHFDKDMEMQVTNAEEVVNDRVRKSPEQADNAPKKKRNRVTPEPQQATIVFDTYSINSKSGITLAHFQLLGFMLEQKRIIKECQGNFIDLFDGRSNNCKITWASQYGLGGLQYLVNELYRKGFINYVGSKYKIAEAHFVDEEGVYVTNLKGAAATDKVKAMIDDCMTAFEVSNPAYEIRKYNASQKEEEDIRVDKSELY